MSEEGMWASIWASISLAVSVLIICLAMTSVSQRKQQAQVEKAYATQCAVVHETLSNDGSHNYRDYSCNK